VLHEAPLDNLKKIVTTTLHVEIFAWSSLTCGHFQSLGTVRVEKHRCGTDSATTTAAIYHGVIHTKIEF